MLFPASFSIQGSSYFVLIPRIFICSCCRTVSGHSSATSAADKSEKTEKTDKTATPDKLLSPRQATDAAEPHPTEPKFVPRKDLLDRLTSLGVDPAEAEKALRITNNNPEAALAYLLEPNSSNSPNSNNEVSPSQDLVPCGDPPEASNSGGQNNSTSSSNPSSPDIARSSSEKKGRQGRSLFGKLTRFGKESRSYSAAEPVKRTPRSPPNEPLTPNSDSKRSSSLETEQSTADKPREKSSDKADVGVTEVEGQEHVKASD